VLIEVILYPQSAFKSVSGGPDWAEGIFDGRMRIPVGDGPTNRLELVLKHELVHALFSVATDGRNLPSWLDEGLAQWLSCQPNCGPYRYPVNPADFLGEAALTTRYTSLNAANARHAYQQSLFLIFVIENEFGDTSLRDIVSQMPKAKDFSGDSLLQVLPLSFAELTKLAKRHWTARTKFSE